ncbi:MAG: protein kinase [Nannocystaceae bacterium]
MSPSPNTDEERLGAGPPRDRPSLFDDCYEIIEVLGIGAKAEVHRAYHRDARRYVALKILRDEAADDPEERRRFDREARVLATLRHPAIPFLGRVSDERADAPPFIAMELRRGEPVVDLDPRLRSPR